MSKAKAKAKGKAKAAAVEPRPRRVLPIRPSTETIRALLERDLIEWADDLELRLVWADLLQIDGDPLGRLVNLDHVAASDASVQAEADALREALAHRLEPPAAPWLTLHWQLGFVHLAEIHVRHQLTPGATVQRRGRQISAIEQRVEAFVALLERPAMRFLDTIHVLAPDEHALAWTRLLWHVSHATLREVHIGDPPRLRTRPSGLYEVGRAQARDYDFSSAGYMAKMPRLQRVTVAGELARLPCREGSSETRAHHVRKLAQRPLTSANRASLRRALWDASGKVQDMAHQTIRALGPAAEFMAEELLLLLLPPIGERDPRQVIVFGTLAAIGPASASILPTLLGSGDMALLTGVDERCIALLEWLRALRRAGRPALELVATLAEDTKASKHVRKAAQSARKALLAEG